MDSLKLSPLVYLKKSSNSSPIQQLQIMISSRILRNLSSFNPLTTTITGRDFLSLRKLHWHRWALINSTRIWILSEESEEFSCSSNSMNSCQFLSMSHLISDSSTTSTWTKLNQINFSETSRLRLFEWHVSNYLHT